MSIFEATPILMGLITKVPERSESHPGGFWAETAATKAATAKKVFMAVVIEDVDIKGL